MLKLKFNGSIWRKMENFLITGYDFATATFAMMFYSSMVCRRVLPSEMFPHSLCSLLGVTGNCCCFYRVARCGMTYPYTRKGKHTLQGKLAWLELFLRRTFFDACGSHQLCKNDQNKYCINCDLPLCRYCVLAGSHHEHDILKIYRHVYKDGVPISEMVKYIDCSKIQPYKCNKLWVLSLKPLPHNGSGSQADNADYAYDTCKRILNEPSLYRYCSLICKVEAFSKKESSSEPPFLEIPNAPTINNPTANAEAKGTKRKRSRKGIPHRVPFFWWDYQNLEDIAKHLNSSHF